MKITLSLADDLYDTYALEARARRIEVDSVLCERLKLAVGLDPRDRGLVITGGPILAQLEQLLGTGHLQSPEDLLAKVRRLAVIRFGEHEFRITAGQYQELAHRATKTGKTIPQLIDAIYQKMQADFWQYVP